MQKDVSGNYTIRLVSLLHLSSGFKTDQITLKLCSEDPCVSVYAGTQRSIAQSFNAGGGDWKTFQRDREHSGYVAASYDVSKFAYLISNGAPPAGVTQSLFSSYDWQGLDWVMSGVHQTATPSLQDRFQSYQLPFFSLPPSLNLQANQALELAALAGPVAVEGHTMYFATLSNFGDRTFWKWNPNTMAAPVSVTIMGERAPFQFPTTYDGTAYLFGSSQRPTSGGVLLFNSLTAFTATEDTTAPTVKWRASLDDNRDVRNESVAVDENYIYAYANRRLQVFNRADGSVAKEILNSGDTISSNTNSDYFGGPIIGGRNNVIAFNNLLANPTNNSIDTSATQRTLVDYDIPSGTVAWRTALAYKTVPALAKGVLYAGRNSQSGATSSALDAIDEATGQVLWSWSPPAGEVFAFNTIVTDNLVLVSTDQKIYAIDLTTHLPVWSYTASGMMVFTFSDKLVVSQGTLNGAPVNLAVFQVR
jgi:outer membrane protein assembly factor BamB